MIRRLALFLVGWIGLAGSVEGQGESSADAIADLQKRCVEAIARAEGSVVSIARVRRDDDAAGFQVPNLGRLGFNGRLEEAFPTDEDFVPTDFGAGVVIDAAGLIVTAYHVLGDVKNSEYFVWLRHKPYKATVVAADGWIDLAVLKVDAQDLVSLPFGDAKEAKKGQFVIVLGNPQAIARDGEISATWGMVSNLKRRAPQVPERISAGIGRETLHHYGTLLQIETRFQPGCSGAAVMNLDGKLVGLMTTYAGNPSADQAAGFAIPVDDPFRHALDQLKGGKSPAFGFLGVGLQSLDARVRRQGRHGALVESVMAGTPASRAKLQTGDVITHLDDVPLFDDDDLIREVSRLPPRQTVKLTVLRAPDAPALTQVLEKSIELTKRSETTHRPAIATIPPPSWRGMQVDDATAAPRDALNAIQLPDAGGLYIRAVTPASPAWNAGLRSGVFITAVAGRSITSATEFFSFIDGQAGGVELTTLVTGGRTKVETVSP